MLLPAELLEKILYTLWMSSLSTKHCIILMKSLPLVNVEWNSLFTAISRQDVFLVNARHYAWYYKLVQKNSAATMKDTQNSFKISFQCQSISARDNCNYYAYYRSYEGDFMPYFKSADFGKSLFPNLNSMFVKITNGFRDVYTELWVDALPTQLSTLYISYTFNEYGYSLHWQEERAWKHHRVPGPGPIPSFIKKLSITGAGSEGCVVQEFGILFSGLESLTSDGISVEFKNLPKPKYLVYDEYDTILWHCEEHRRALMLFQQQQEELGVMLWNKGILGAIKYISQLPHELS